MKIKRKILLFIVGVLTVPLVVYLLIPDWLPSKKEIKGCLTTKMYEVHLCPGSDDYVPLKQISSSLQKAIVLTEDSGFFQHHGFDWKSIEQNARKGLATGSFKHGGSSITQQLAKNMFLSKERSFWRKAKEALIADRLESTLTKNEILERYLNVIEFGKDVYGVKAAAKFYFKKSPADLDVVESAFLAMLLPNPIKYSQSYYKKALTPFAQSRMNKIVHDMYQYNRITEEQYQVASDKLSWFFKPSSPPIGENMNLTDEELSRFDDEYIPSNPSPADVDSTPPPYEEFPDASTNTQAPANSNFDDVDSFDSSAPEADSNQNHEEDGDAPLQTE